MKNFLLTMCIPIGLVACGESQISTKTSDVTDETETSVDEETESTATEEETSTETSTEEQTSTETSTGTTTSSETSTETSTETDEEEEVVEVMSFRKVELFQLPGAAWVEAQDLNNDGKDEYIIISMTEGVGDWPSFIGAGAAYILSQDTEPTGPGDVGGWSAEVVFDRTSEIDWPNDPRFFDVNNDGVKDWVMGTGFIPLPDGGITWLPGIETTNGQVSFDVPDIIDTPWTDRFYHSAYPVDMDGDGDMDFVTTNYKNAETDWLGNETAPGEAKLEWYENDGIVGAASFTHHEIADRGGALLKLHDVDGDGDTDIIVPQYWNGMSLIWMENNGDGSSWTEHLINDTTGRGFDVELADMNGDGKLDILYGNHNHQLASDITDQVMGVYWFEIPEPSELQSLSNWNAYMNIVYEGFYVDESDPKQNGAPGVTHAGDVNGDGMIDVSVAGDGDDGIYVFVQQTDGSFEETLIDSNTVMSGDHHMADFDGDGKMDYIWAIYGTLDLFSGQLEPDSVVNIYLQETTLVSGDIETYSGDINFEITTDYGPDTCTGTVDIDVNNSTVNGSYQCSFGVLGSQNNPITGTIASDGSITGGIDVTISFSNSTYTLDWNGAYDGSQITASTTGNADLDGMAIGYTLGFTAQ